MITASPRSAYCLRPHLCRPAGAAADLFDLLGRLPRQLYPPALSAVHSLELDVFPAAPSDWLLLQGLPCLQELLLPPFMPSLPHAHLPMVAELTQLTALTASVQVCGSGAMGVGGMGGVIWRGAKDWLCKGCEVVGSVANLHAIAAASPPLQGG
jgi:hypothetical protein